MHMTAVLSPASRLRELEKKRFHVDRKGRIPVMDAETLRELCLDNDGYETPELNDNLYAHFQGFQRIEGLEPYANLKALWLESNGLTKIENLASLINLRCLYLSKNLIERVENLECLRELNTLDLSDNRITRLSGLAHLPQLSSLNLSRNQLETSEDIQELALCTQLTNVDLSHNRIEDPLVLSILQQIPQLRALRITGNGVVSKTRFFRKVYISSLPQLSFLDRPIFPMERSAVAAWKVGGNEAELEAKRTFVNKEHDERRRTLHEFRDWQAQVREKRIKELEEERKQKEQQQLQDKENNSDNNSISPATEKIALESINLKGFRGITKEQYAQLNAQERAKWDERIERAHADSVTERYEVLGDGVSKTGAKFWASETQNARQQEVCSEEDQPPALLQLAGSEEVEADRNDTIGTTTTVSPVRALQQQRDSVGITTSARMKTLDGLSATAAAPTADAALAEDLQTGEVASSSSHAQSSQQEAANSPTKPDSQAILITNDGEPVVAAILASDTSIPSIAVVMPPPAPAVAQRDPATFFREVGEVRETWAQLEQRARQSSFLHRPQQLPSVHTLGHADDEEEEDNERDITARDTVASDDGDRSGTKSKGSNCDVATSVVALSSPSCPRSATLTILPRPPSSLSSAALPPPQLPLRALTRDEILLELRSQQCHAAPAASASASALAPPPPSPAAHVSRTEGVSLSRRTEDVLSGANEQGDAQSTGEASMPLRKDPCHDNFTDVDALD